VRTWPRGGHAPALGREHASHPRKGVRSAPSNVGIVGCVPRNRTRNRRSHHSLQNQAPVYAPQPYAGSLPVYWDVTKVTGRVCLGSLPMWLLVHLLNRFIRNGVLRLIAADGSLHIFGGHGLGPTVTVRLHDPRLCIKLFLNPELHAGEAYMNGTLRGGLGCGLLHATVRCQSRCPRGAPWSSIAAALLARSQTLVPGESRSSCGRKCPSSL
jgi:hypothetical protein